LPFCGWTCRQLGMPKLRFGTLAALRRSTDSISEILRANMMEEISPPHAQLISAAEGGGGEGRELCIGPLMVPRSAVRVRACV